MFHMMGVFAEFERSIIQERVRAGLRKTREEGRNERGRTQGRAQDRDRAWRQPHYRSEMSVSPFS